RDPRAEPVSTGPQRANLVLQFGEPSLSKLARDGGTVPETLRLEWDGARRLRLRAYGGLAEDHGGYETGHLPSLERAIELPGLACSTPSRARPPPSPWRTPSSSRSTATISRACSPTTAASCPRSSGS